MHRSGVFGGNFRILMRGAIIQVKTISGVLAAGFQTVFTGLEVILISLKTAPGEFRAQILRSIVIESPMLYRVPRLSEGCVCADRLLRHL